MKLKWIPPLLCLLLLVGCSGQTNTEESKAEGNAYTQISAEEAKTMMDEQESYILLDVRTQEEYAEGHIEEAILIPDHEIAERAEKELTDKEMIILIYCRSGRRSKLAAQNLADLGYTNVYEFGGIIDWPYDIVK